MGGHGEEATELHVACFMGLVSFFASRAEVLNVGARVQQRLLNAAARAIIQSSTATSSPLTDAGLDGTGEVIQVREVDRSLHCTGTPKVPQEGVVFRLL